MYIAPPHRQLDTLALTELIRDFPLATLITLSDDGIEANHIPLLWQAPNNQQSGRLIGHVARANSLWQQHPQAQDVLAVFSGPGTYISPSLHATKPETGKVVPTWQYLAVHAKGRMTVHHDDHWLQQQLDLLTAEHEQDRVSPWRTDDAPAAYITALKKAIVGIEITVDSLVGKWKLSQKENQRNRDSITQGLTSSQRDSDIKLSNYLAKTTSLE